MSKTKFQIFSITVFFGLVLQTASCSGGQIQAHENQESYKADCEEVPVSELTEGAEDFKGKLIKIAGQVVVYYEEEGATHLIIAVKDEVYTLPSGLLPIYIYYDGSTAAFINDEIIVYGEIYGYDICPSPQIEDKELPRVDAKYIEII